MAAIDEARERGGLAEPARRREEPDRLVAPRVVERMLVDGHELEVREPHVRRVGDERVGELVVGEPAVAFAAPPGAEMHFVDRHRRAARIPRGPRRHPVGVGPDEARGVAHDRRGRGSKLRAEADGIGLERKQRAVGADDFVLVERALGERGDEDLPDARADALAHGVAAAVPGIEVADDGNALRVRRPHREMHALDTFVLDGMGAQAVVELRVRAFADQPVVERTEHRPVRVRIVDEPGITLVRGAQPIRRSARNRALEKSGVVPARERRERRAIARYDIDGSGAGNERPHDDAAVSLVDAEHRERVGMAAFDDRVDGGGGQHSCIETQRTGSAPRARSPARSRESRGRPKTSSCAPY